MIKTELHPSRWWDFPAALLLMAAMLTAGTRLVATDWTAHLSLVQTLVFFSLIAGLALGTSRFSSRTAAFFAAIFGVFAVPWQLGTTLPANYTWLERMVILISRLQIIINQLILHEPVRDSLLFLATMFALFWTIAIFAGYALTRHGDAWQASLPAGLAMFVIHSFDSAVSSRIWYLAAYLFFCLILAARMVFIQHRSQWQNTRATIPPHISLDFIRYTILITFFIVIFAWTMPALAKALPEAAQLWQPVRAAWSETVNNFENAFASLKATVFTYTAVYSPTSSLGRGSVLTDAQVFRASAPVDMPTGTRLYWRARVYDTYQNGQWQANFDQTRNFNPFNEDLPIEPGISRWQGSFSIISASHITTLFTPAQPLWVSRFGEVEFLQNPDGTIDISTFSADPSISPGESYDILASLSSPTADDLRSDHTDYPSWVKERYLQLPETITPRTRELAERITTGLETPYDKALAITNYLRSNIRYVQVLDQAPPSSQEPIDWFLFQSRAGFCNYYSSAEIIMLRALGIPARWAVGYAQGEALGSQAIGALTNKNIYVIRQKDAHSWPEVFFPSYGWVEFEPTTSQPALVRQESNQSLENEAPTLDEELAALTQDKRGQLALLREAASQEAAAGTQAEPIRRVSWIFSLAAGVLLLALALVSLPLFGLPAAPTLLETLFLRLGLNPPEPVRNLAAWAEQAPKPRPIQIPPFPLILERTFQHLGLRPPRFVERWARQVELPPLSKAYLEINHSLARLGKQPGITETPAERAAALGKALPVAETPARELVNQYQIGTFSTLPVDLSLARKSASEIRRLSYFAILKRFFERFQKPAFDPRLQREPSPNSQKPEN